VFLEQPGRHLGQACQQVERVGRQAAGLEVKEAQGSQAVAFGGDERGACGARMGRGKGGRGCRKEG
jgi:hypothetical protein